MNDTFGQDNNGGSLVRGADARPLGGSERRNVETVLASYRAFAEVWDEDRLRILYTDAFHDHSRLHGADVEALASFLQRFRGEHPDSRIEIKRLLVDGDFVVAHVLASMDRAREGSLAIEIFRLEDGRIAEHWDAFDHGPPPPDAVEASTATTNS